MADKILQEFLRYKTEAESTMTNALGSRAVFSVLMPATNLETGLDWSESTIRRGRGLEKNNAIPLVNLQRLVTMFTRSRREYIREISAESDAQFRAVT